MKIYINTNKQPPSVAADSSGIQTMSSFAFKRGTTVPMEVFLKGAEDVSITKMRYGLKLKGKYDDLLVVSAELESSGEETEQGRKFVLKPTFSADVIDKALSVDGDGLDDIEKANFISEFEWENADGEISASATVATVLHNNVVRRAAGGTSGSNAGAEWVALMVVRMSWAEFTALPERNPDVLYHVSDAPDLTALHDESATAHAKLFSEWEVKMDGKLAELLVNIAKLPDASATVKGIVQLGSGKTPAAETEPAVGNDSAGKLCVPGLSAMLPSLLKTVPGTPNENVDGAHGFLGTLRDLGAFGNACAVRTVTIRTRLNGTLVNGNVAFWVRILKVVDGEWAVAAQSEHALKCNDYGNNTDMTFVMAASPNVVPPSADEKIAIVFVNNPSASAEVSNGGFSLRCINGRAGGFTSSLGTPSGATSNAAWSPYIKLRFTPMDSGTANVSLEDFNTFAASMSEENAALAARLAALENNVLPENP